MSSSQLVPVPELVKPRQTAVRGSLATFVAAGLVGLILAVAGVPLGSVLLGLALGAIAGAILGLSFALADASDIKSRRARAIEWNAALEKAQNWRYTLTGLEESVWGKGERLDPATADWVAVDDTTRHDSLVGLEYLPRYVDKPEPIRLTVQRANVYRSGEEEPEATISFPRASIYGNGKVASHGPVVVLHGIKFKDSQWPMWKPGEGAGSDLSWQIPG